MLQIPIAFLVGAIGFAALGSGSSGSGADGDKKETVESRLLRILKDRGVLSDAEFAELNEIGARMRAEETIANATLERNVLELTDRVLSQGDKKAAEEPKITYKHGRGVNIKFSDDFGITFNGFVQPRFSYINPGGLTSKGNDPRPTFEVRRLRVNIESQVMKDTTVRLQFDAAPNNGILRDGYIDHRFAQELHVRGGQMKRPFSRQQWSGVQFQQFIERSAVVERFRSLAGDRSNGAMLWGEVGEHKQFEWYAGVFNGEALNNTNANPDNLGAATGGLLPANASNDDTKPEAVARLVLNPMGQPGYSEGDLEMSDPKVSVGLGYMYTPERRGDPLGFPNPTPVALKEYDVHTIGADFAFKASGFFATGEYYYREIDPKDGLDAGTSVGVAVETGWFAQLGYFFGTEKNNGPEIAARFNLIDFQNDVPLTSESGETMIQDWQLAFSYYFAGHFAKLQADYTYREEDLRVGKDQQDHVVRLQAQVFF